MKLPTIFLMLMLIVLVSGCDGMEQLSITNDTMLVVVDETNITEPTFIAYQMGTFDPVRPNKSAWVCYDYSINYAREHPEWGVVTMSDNPNFYGISHMVNYKIVNGTMLIHDEMNDYNCYFRFDNRTTNNPYYEQTYYKFYTVNETPLRNYKYMVDNSETFFTTGS